MPQKTLVLLKPDALKRNLVDTLIQEFESHGFIILRQKEVVVNQETILNHYEEVIARVPIPDFKDRIIKAFVGQTIRCLEVSSTSDHTIDDLRSFIGATDPAKADPKSLRGKYGVDTMEKSSLEKRMLENLIHASDSLESAQRELNLWFH